MTATDAALIALGERFEKLLLEHMDAWLEWAPRMRAAHAEVRDNMAALAVAIQGTGCDVAQARMSELERDMQPLRQVFHARAVEAALVEHLHGHIEHSLGVVPGTPASSTLCGERAVRQGHESYLRSRMTC